MNALWDSFVIFFLFFFLFGIQHSVLASLGIKKKLRNVLGNKIAFYRIFYILFSLLTFGLFYYLAPKPGIVVYSLPYPFDLIVLTVQFLSLILLLWTAKFIDVKEFLGINQIKRYFKNEYNEETLDEVSEFRVEGPYKIVRHPIYFFSILFLIFRASMDLFYLDATISMIIYFFVGAYYEEKKLVKVFGNKYSEYQKKVPMIFPNLFRKKK